MGKVAVGKVPRSVGEQCTAQEDDGEGGVAAEAPQLGRGGEQAEGNQQGDRNQGAQKELRVEIEDQVAPKVGQVELPKREDSEQVLHRLRVADAEGERKRADNLIPVRGGRSA